MRKDFGPKTYFFPLPVLIIGTYNENMTPNAMNAAWGSIYDYNKITISLGSHKTTDNLLRVKEFTIAFADTAHVKEADYVGIVSGEEVEDKVARANLKVEKAKNVNAPLFVDFPVSLECKVDSLVDGTLIGSIVNVSADESVLDETGKIDVSKLHIISYDPVTHTYIEMGQKVGNAFKDGKMIK